MAIHSHAFGRVTLTKDDAAKFDRQVKYGRSNVAAKESVKRGLALSQQFATGGKVVVQATRSKKEEVSG